ncbi:MAG: hypothetical protein Q4F67_06395 [Propionibacteriaceae bacterium]|nr:hypothetical protein [Propionibacteriaceae bacterium]
MATWEDGPEYAPAARPDVFAAPAAVRPLDKAPERQIHSAGAPLIAPAFDQREQIAPLAQHHPDTGPHRDPNEPYAVAASAMTEADSAWGTVVHYHVQPGDWAPPTGPPVGGLAPTAGGSDPRTPIHIAGSPPPPGLAAGPGPAPQAEWLPPGPAPTEQEPSPRFGEVFNAVTTPTFVTLLIGGLAMAVPLFGWLSPLMFVLAFFTSSRIAYRRHWVRLAFLVGAGGLGTTIVVGLVFSPVSLIDYFQLVQAVSTVVCWLVLASVLAIVWQALAAGEQPEYPAPRRASGWD